MSETSLAHAAEPPYLREERVRLRGGRSFSDGKEPRASVRERLIAPIVAGTKERLRATEEQLGSFGSDFQFIRALVKSCGGSERIERECAVARFSQRKERTVSECRI